MPSYDEYFRSSVLASLASLDIEIKKVVAARNASMFTLYYAQGARITATERLGEARKTLDRKKQVRNQAVLNYNACLALAGPVDQAGMYVKQAMTDTSVFASKMQASANTVVRIASDMGSIYSVVNAADRNSDIYMQLAELRELTDKAAYHAETLSQDAMNASILTSEVSWPTVQDNASVIRAAAANLLTVVSGELANAIQVVADSEAVLASCISVEKIAAANYALAVAGSQSAVEAYVLANNMCNIELSVHTLGVDSFVVGFKPIKNPFKIPGMPPYPVSAYYIIVVKDAKKTAFSLSQAENILTNKRQHISIDPSSMRKRKLSKTAHDVFIEETIHFGYSLPLQTKNVLQDSDGDKIELGVQYVVFVLGVYMDDHKKKLNNFDDFLSAPSASFTLSYKLAEVSGSSIAIDPVKPNLLHFTIKEGPAYSKWVEYRCIFLPKAKNKDGEPAIENVKRFEQKGETLESIAETYDPKISSCQSDILSIRASLDLLNAKLETTAAKTASEKKQVKEYKAKIKKLQAMLANHQSDLADLRSLKQKAITHLSSADRSTVDFLFNVEIAEQVTSGNYIVATRAEKTGDNIVDETIWNVAFGVDATDNFGNPLMEGQLYIPVVLSVSTAPLEERSRFTNSWSGYQASPEIIYQPGN